MADRALLVMDVQEAVVARYPDPGYLPRLAEAIASGGSARSPAVIWGWCCVPRASATSC